MEQEDVIIPETPFTIASIVVEATGKLLELQATGVLAQILPSEFVPLAMSVVDVGIPQFGEQVSMHPPVAVIITVPAKPFTDRARTLAVIVEDKIADPVGRLPQHSPSKDPFIDDVID